MAEFELDHSAFKLEPVPVKGRTGTTAYQQCPTNQKLAECAKLKKSTKGTWQLPKGLVGSRCTAVVNISGQDCHCLLDTGSQVTTIPVSLYNLHFSDQPVKPLHDLLQVEGAAGQAVPYIGYIETTIMFPQDFLGTAFEVPTLAPIVPDVRPGSQSSVLIGMITLEALYTQYDNDNSTFLPTLFGYHAVLKVLQVRHQQNQERNIRLASKTPVLIPDGQTIVVDGTAELPAPSRGQCALIEHSPVPLPGGLCVANCLITLEATIHNPCCPV